MSTGTTHQYLVRLHNLILQERESAKVLDMTAMTAATAEKAELIQVLAHIKLIDEEDKSIAAKIRHENRRNAFLFKSTLGWIRDTMEFFGQKTVTSTYSPNAYTVSSQVNGRLLSGKI